MEIRRFAASDSGSELSRVYEESWKFAYKGIVPQSYLDAIPSGKWADVAEREGRVSLVLTDNERLVGTVSFGRSRFKEWADWGEIVSLYLLPAYMGKGLGSRLLRTAREELAQMGFSRCFLWVLEENTRARRFYEKEGFSESGEALINEIGGKALREIQYVKTDL
ncbi:MAG: GNAT family N-acetyltransferase [Bacteroides sp.]|nr:GNAT family N-acetyltransferase [Eubacterium sp.]MCM1417230.1 GNAT family N-acetyltransferase [Roseburia sp.]MCM1461149.1 GNAT family N-acetyltransferase [Bacteroides sp.]